MWILFAQAGQAMLLAAVLPRAERQNGSAAMIVGTDRNSAILNSATTIDSVLTELDFSDVGGLKEQETGPSTFLSRRL